MKIHRKAINQENRTIEVAFSSESVIQDWPGHYHKLDHSPGAVDLSRLENGAAVLVNHNYEHQVGVVESAHVDSDDRVGRAVLRFGKNARAQEEWQDVIDGIRQHISVGAEIVGSVEREENDGNVILHVRKWQPVEISLVSVPADVNAGIGRTHQKSKLPKEPKMEPNEQDPHVKAQAERELEKNVLTRLNEIYAIGREFNCQDLAAEYATNGKTSEREIIELNRKAFDHWKTEQEAVITREEKNPSDPITAIGLSDKEVQRFSVTRALDGYLMAREGVSDPWKEASFEKACSDQIKQMLDREPNGVFIPHEIQNKSIRRDMAVGDAGAGAEFVGTQLDAGNFIEQLRTNVVAAQLGARMLPGLRQNLDIPRKTAASSFSWLAERGTVTLTDLGTGVVSLQPRTIGGGIEATRRMLKQSTPAMDDMMMSDLGQGAAETIDLGALQGSGASNQPTGIVNQTGVNTQIVNPAGQPTWGEIVGFETAVAADNALRGSLGWATTSGVVGYLKTTEKAANTGRFIMDNEGMGFGGTPNTLNGYRVAESNQLDAGRMIFGNWSELLIGMWGVLDLRPDPYTNASSDGLVIRAFQDIDIALRHGESFCINVLV